MCDESGKLMALLDGELAAGEAAEVERHLGACAECSGRLRSYERLSHCIDAYCDEKLEASEPRGAVPGKSALVGAGAAAVVAIAVVFLLVPRVRDVRPSAGLPRAAAPVAVVAQAPHVSPSPVRKIHRHPESAPAPVREANWLPAEPGIQIAIPADAVFPPGAVPEGVTFVADVRIAADGSAQQVIVWP